MRLKAAAAFFDRLVCVDSYDPDYSFAAQMDVFDDSRRDGMTVERRILSVAPSVVMPPRRTITVDGQTWLVGDHNRDFFKTEAIRHKYVIHLASGQAAVKTFAEAIAGTAGTALWASRNWVKGSKEVDIASQIVNVFDIYFAPGESLFEGALVQFEGRWHLIRSLYPSTAGLLVALADELPEPVVVTATFDQRTYVPATDSYTTSPLAVTGVRLHWQSFFRYPQKGVSKYGAGDEVLAVRKADITPKAGDRVSIGSTTFVIESTLDEGACWSLHLCNA